MMNRNIGTDCSGRTCGYGAFDGDLGCTDGASCSQARMLSAQESKFHDATLAEASKSIDKILSSIPSDPAGRQLSFLHTKMGTVLAWVRHDVEVPKGCATAESPDHELSAALGLIDPPMAAR
jgi:hypothetical protein